MASLGFLGFDVTAEQNGADALRLARARPFDLLILDVMLPGIDSFEIVRFPSLPGDFDIAFVPAHGGTAQAAPVRPHGPRVTLTLRVRAAPRSAAELTATA